MLTIHACGVYSVFQTIPLSQMPLHRRITQDDASSMVSHNSTRLNLCCAFFLPAQLFALFIS